MRVMALAVLGALLACGGPQSPPQRGVIESDLDGWNFRRYQSVLDIEVWVPKNKAVAFTASYARGTAEKRGRLSDTDVANVFVTRYATDEGVAIALLRFARRLARESGYRVEERKIEGIRVLLVTGSGEKWAMWNAKGHVLKIGGRGIDSVPDSIVEAYGERYPSKLPSDALNRPLDPEPTTDDAEPEPFDSDAPRPDWKKQKSGGDKK